MVEINVTQKSVFNKVFAHLTSPCNSIFIGGGAVADLLRAGDIDVWFGKKREGEAVKFLNSFHHRSSPSHLLDYDANGAKLYGSVWDPAIGKVIQVLTLEVDTPEEAINAWDISTHMWGYTSRGRLVKGDKATDVTVPPQVINISEGSWGRYIKICKRYHYPVDESVLKGMDDKEGPEKKPISVMATSSMTAMNKALDIEAQAAWKKWLNSDNTLKTYPVPNPKKYIQPNFIYDQEDVKAEGDYLDDPPF